jgi:hypothetical protein
MANKDQPIGFRPYDGILRARPYDIDATTTCFINDLLSMDVNDGYPNQTAATDTTIIGATQNYRASTAAAGTVIVFDHPRQLFVAQGDGADLADISCLNQNADVTVGTGSATTYLSAMEIDSSDAAAAAAQIHLIRKVATTNNAWGANVDMICSIYEHMLGVSGGTGFI